MDEETKQAIAGIDKRVRYIEALIGNNKEAKAKLESSGTKKYSGLQGGIELLIDENFFSIQKSRDEIHKELARHGYHPAKSAMQTALNRDFMKKKRILTRIKDGKVYKYVIRK